MRANKDEGKPEGHTLMKFAYPYFRDTGLVVSCNYSLNGKLCVKKKTYSAVDTPYSNLCDITGVKSMGSLMKGFPSFHWSSG